MTPLIQYLLALQVVLPLALIVANALVPAASGVGLALRTLAVAGVLVWTALSGVWLWPPWWTPVALGALHVGLSAWALRRRRRRSRRRGGGRAAWAEAGLALAALAGVSVLLLPALAGRTPPDDAVDLAMPLGPGRYLVVHGGTTVAVNIHLKTLVPAGSGEPAADWRGQSFAVDIVEIDALGRRAAGISPADPAAYLIHGRAILAPCAGEVAWVIDGVAENAVPRMRRDAMIGNGVMLSCRGVQVLLAHMIPGSVAVAPGETVARGQRLGRVGNSGNSGEPHLHLHAQRPAPGGAPLSAAPLWLTLDGRFPVRNDRLRVAP